MISIPPNPHDLGIFESRLSGSIWSTLQRAPNGNPRRGLCSSPEDIAGGVGVGVCRVPAMSAVENRLALAVRLIDAAAGMARQRRVRGVDFSQFASALCHFVRQQVFKLAPAVSENDPVQARFLAHIPARLGDRPSGARRHVCDFQRLDHDDAVAVGYFGRPFMVPVSAQASGFRSSLRYQFAGCHPAVRSPLASGQGALVLAGAAIKQFQPFARHIHESAVRQGDSTDDASIDANGRAEVCGGVVLYGAAEGDMPPERIASDRHVFDGAGDAAREPKPDVSDLREPDNCPFFVELAPRAFRSGEPEAVALPFLVWGRRVGSAGKEVLVRSLKVAQHFLLADHRYSRNPFEFGSQSGEFAVLRLECQVPAGIGSVLAPPVPALLQPEIIDEAADPRVLPEQPFLFRRRVEPKSVASGNHGLRSSSRTLTIGGPA